MSSNIGRAQIKKYISLVVYLHVLIDTAGLGVN